MFLHSSCARRATARSFFFVIIFFSWCCSVQLSSVHIHTIQTLPLERIRQCRHFFSNRFGTVCCYSVNYVALKRRRWLCMFWFFVFNSKERYIFILFIYGAPSCRQNRLYLCAEQSTDYVYISTFFSFAVLLNVCTALGCFKKERKTKIQCRRHKKTAVVCV